MWYGFELEVLIKFVDPSELSDIPPPLWQVCRDGRPILSFDLDPQEFVKGVADEHIALVTGIYLASILRWDIMLPHAVASGKCGSLDTRCNKSISFQV